MVKQKKCYIYTRSGKNIKDTPKIEISMQLEEDSLYEPKDKGI